jgi:hypothetical protein
MTVLAAPDAVEGRCVAVVEYAGRKHMEMLAVRFLNCSEYYMWGEVEEGKGEHTDYPVNSRNQGVKSVIRNSRATALWILENVSTCYVKIARGLTWLASDPV